MSAADDLIKKLSLAPNTPLPPSPTETVIVENIVSRMVEVGILTPEQGFNVLFTGEKPTEFLGMKVNVGPPQRMTLLSE